MQYPFKQLKTREIPENLADRIIMRLERAEYARNRNLLIGFASVSLITFISIIEAFQKFIAGVASSEFRTYASLIFSDGSSMIALWKPFLFSLVETAPVLGIGVVLACATICVWAIARTLAYARSMRGAFALS